MGKSLFNIALSCLFAGVMLSGQSFADNAEAGKQPDSIVTAAVADSKALSAAAIAPEQDEYVIGYLDLLEIEVFQSQTFSKAVRVNSRGIISLPLIGTIQAGGRTSQELETDIATKLSESYMQDPQVSVFVKEYTSQRVTVEGNVKNAGVYPLKGRTTLLQVIAMASGLDGLANTTEIRILRSVNGEKTSLLYNLESIRTGGTEDPVVKGEDRIVVDSSSGKSILKEFKDILPILSFGLFLL
ncbi:MAG: polysaccharide biosynthesis/export family protein [Sulfuricella sp.]|nr:polysaccharide biosynthesis/export family protein [Sulfuricella sp.]